MTGRLFANSIQTDTINEQENIVFFENSIQTAENSIYVGPNIPLSTAGQALGVRDIEDVRGGFYVGYNFTDSAGSSPPFYRRFDPLAEVTRQPSKTTNSGTSKFTFDLSSPDDYIFTKVWLEASENSTVNTLRILKNQREILRMENVNFTADTEVEIPVNPVDPGLVPPAPGEFNLGAFIRSGITYTLEVEGVSLKGTGTVGTDFIPFFRQLRADYTITDLLGEDVIQDDSTANDRILSAEQINARINSAINAGGGGGGLGPFTPFTDSITVDATNFENFDNEVALYVRQTDARVNFILPSDSVITAANGFPARITVLNQGGTGRFTTGFNPTNTVVIDVAGANNIRRNSETGALLNFVEAHQNDLVVLTKEDAASPWVATVNTLSQGALLLPDGIFNLEAGASAFIRPSLGFITISPTIVNPSAGDAYRIGTGGAGTLNGYPVKEGDVLVALIDNPSRLLTNNNDWLLIRNSHNNTVSLQELHFLNQVTETDTNVYSRLIDRSDVNEVNVWLSPFILDHAPFLTPSADSNNPQSGETDPYVGGREDRGTDNEFELNSGAPNSFVYVDIDGSFNVNDLDNVFLTIRDRDGNVITRHSLDTEFRGITLSGSTDTYYVFDDVGANDNFSSISYVQGQTIDIEYRGTVRTFTLDDSVDVRANIPEGGLTITKLDQQTQALINSDHSLSDSQETKLDGLQATGTATPWTAGELYVKDGEASDTLSDYVNVDQLNGIIPNYERTRTVTFLVPNFVTVTGLVKAEDNTATLSVTPVGTILGRQAFRAVLPSITGANSPLDNVWVVNGTASNLELTGANDSFKIHRGNLDQDLLTALDHGNTPPAPYELPDNLNVLNHHLSHSEITNSGWRAVLRNPYRTTLTRQFAALWDEDRNSFTGNYFDDITGMEVVGFSPNNVFYYTDPNDRYNTSFPGAQSYLLNSNARFRNTPSTNDVPITPNLTKVIGFDYALQRNLISGDNENMVRLGNTSSTALIGLAEDEGLYLNIGRSDGGQQSRTYNSQFQVDNNQWSTAVGQSVNTESEVIIPSNLSGSLTLTVGIRAFDNDNDEGEHTENITITNLTNDQSFGNRTFSYTIDGNPVNLTVGISYDAVNNDLSVPRRVLLLTATLDNAALHYTIEAYHSVTETWSTSTTYARRPINAGSGHDDFGFFDPHEWNTEHVTERNRVMLLLQKYRLGDTSSNPEMAVKVIVDGQREGQPSENYVIRLHRPASDFDFNDINIGNNICAVSHIQCYDYLPGDGDELTPSITELQSMYNQANSWLGAFRDDDVEVETIKLDSNFELLNKQVLIVEGSETSGRYEISVDDSDTSNPAINIKSI